MSEMKLWARNTGDPLHYTMLVTGDTIYRLATGIPDGVAPEGWNYRLTVRKENPIAPLTIGELRGVSHNIDYLVAEVDGNSRFKKVDTLDDIEFTLLSLEEVIPEFWVEEDPLEYYVPRVDYGVTEDKIKVTGNELYQALGNLGKPSKDWGMEYTVKGTLHGEVTLSTPMGYPIQVKSIRATEGGNGEIILLNNKIVKITLLEVKL